MKTPFLRLVSKKIVKDESAFSPISAIFGKIFFKHA